jgi:DDE superfamily endonuclease
VRQQRTAVDYAQFLQHLLEKHSPAIDPIRLVQDNLNTHTGGAFYEVLPPEEAFALSQQFALHYTPKKGSWLTMAEMEFAALSTPCLDRRMADVDTLRQEVLAWTTKRNHAHKTVNWRFSQTDARTKLQRHYQKVQKFI